MGAPMVRGRLFEVGGVAAMIGIGELVTERSRGLAREQPPQQFLALVWAERRQLEPSRSV
jgi:hypothetical protein